MIQRHSAERKPKIFFVLYGLLTIAIFLVLFFVLSEIYVKLDQRTILFTPLDGPLLNPLMGLAPWGNENRILQPHTLVYADLSWRNFEPEEGKYDFDAFEKSNQLNRWRLEGKRVIFRFVTDFPGDEKHIDIPDWLFEKINGDGTFYDNEYGRGFSPNYSNPDFMRYHQRVIKALGEHYGGDSFFAFIELGSLGHWGEWHTYDMQLFPSTDVREKYVLDYVDAFPKTHLLMRRPFTIASDLNLGLYNDMTGNFQATSEWLAWIDNGGPFLPQEIGGVVPMPNGWKLAPIGGEQAPIVKNDEMYGSDLDSTLLLLKQSHTTFIGPGGPYDVPLNSLLQNGIDKALSVIGYRLYVSRVELPTVVRFRRAVNLNIQFSNSGIAPFYYPWNVYLYLFDENGGAVRKDLLPIDIRQITPEQIYSFSYSLSVENLNDGTYTLGIAIIDPITGAPGVRFANINERDDLIQQIGSFQVKKINTFLGE